VEKNHTRVENLLGPIRGSVQAPDKVLVERKRTELSRLQDLLFQTKKSGEAEKDAGEKVELAKQSLKNNKRDARERRGEKCGKLRELRKDTHSQKPGDGMVMHRAGQADPS